MLSTPSPTASTAATAVLYCTVLLSDSYYKPEGYPQSGLYVALQEQNLTTMISTYNSQCYHLKVW